MSKEYDNCDPLWLPIGIAPAGMVYSWASKCTNLEKGFYKIVPRQRHPYIYSDDRDEGTISRKGSFLVERKRDIQEAFDVIRTAENEGRLGNTPGLSEQEDDLTSNLTFPEIYNLQNYRKECEEWYDKLPKEDKEPDENWDKFIIKEKHKDIDTFLEDIEKVCKAFNESIGPKGCFGGRMVYKHKDGCMESLNITWENDINIWLNKE